MPELSFSGRCPFTLVPYRWTYRLALGLIEMWRDLDAVARFALERRGYGNTDSGFGLEYPTRPDRQGMVRYWRWDWSVRPLKTRKWHFPEADYLATLVARLRVAGKDELASPIVALMPLPEVTLLPHPDPYDIANYTFHCVHDFSYAFQHSLRMILDQRDFTRARERLTNRLPFTLPDGSGIEYRAAGKLILHLHHGHQQETTEEFYLSVLDKAEKAYHQWTATHCASD